MTDSSSLVCPRCAAQVADDATVCPECGHQLQPAPPPAAGGLGCAILGALLLLVSLVLLFGMLAGGLLGS